MKEFGNICGFTPLEDEEHGFFNYGRNSGIAFKDTMEKSYNFLKNQIHKIKKPSGKFALRFFYNWISYLHFSFSSIDVFCKFSSLLIKSLSIILNDSSVPSL